jgi:hypothetical protein
MIPEFSPLLSPRRSSPASLGWTLDFDARPITASGRPSTVVQILSPTPEQYESVKPLLMESLDALNAKWQPGKAG